MVLLVFMICGSGIVVRSIGEGNLATNIFEIYPPIIYLALLFMNYKG